MTNPDSAQLKHVSGWQLNTLLIIGTVLLTNLVVAIVDWLLLSRVSADSMKVSTVSGLIIATLVVSVAGKLRARIAAYNQLLLEQSMVRAQDHLALAIEAAQMIYWEFDLVTGRFCYDTGQLVWLGLPQATQANTLQDWLALIHPDDQAPFMQRFQAAYDSGAADFCVDYRMRQADGGWGWVQTQARVKERNPQGAPTLAVGNTLNINQRKQTEQTLQLSERRTQALYGLMRLVTDNVPDMIWAKDLDKCYLFANQAYCDQLLLAHDTTEPLGKTDLFFAQRQRQALPDNPHWFTFGELCQDSDTVTLAKGQAMQFEEFGNVRGQPLYLDVRKAPLLDENGAVIGVVGSARDITAERATQEKLRVAAAILKNSSESLVLSDADNRIVDINPAFTRLTGYTLAEVQGQNPRILQSGQQGKAFYQAMWADIESTGRWQGEIWNRRKDGTVYAEWLTINTLYNDDGSVHRRVGLFSDITDKKRSAELVWTQANFDHLTGLPNRRMFLDRLTQDLKKAHRGGFKLALMFVDLDHFKEINDTLGHALGDVLLKEAAARLTACIRESDTVARLGGDEFTVILAELTDTTGIDRIAQDILTRMAAPFALDANQSYVSASIGITLYPLDAADLDDLMKNADQAMYASKARGRNQFSYLTPTMQSVAMHRLHLQDDLRQALQQHQFELHYQPIVALPGGQIHKAEALLRWTHPERGVVSPAEFIPLAEDCGLIQALGNWVFAQAAAQAKAWRTQIDPSFQISVNVSPLQLQTGAERFAWQTAMQAQQLDGDAVVLEITEGMLLQQSASVSAELLAWRDAGLQVAIDDFGTGYSAMAYLKQMDIDYLKIDQSFVRNLNLQGSDHALCEAIVVMAHKLGLQVIAEGVETALQRDLLQAMGCDFAQGFLYAKALPAAEFERLLPRPKATRND